MKWRVQNCIKLKTGGTKKPAKYSQVTFGMKDEVTLQKINVISVVITTLGGGT